VLRSAQPGSGMPDDDERAATVSYLGVLLETGDYPHTQRLFEEHEIESGLDLMIRAFRNPERFGRGLERLLDGLEASLAKS
jgi:hypothetical protein